MPETFKGTIFLLALVTAASMMPVEKLPVASWQTALGLGFVSAVFDNIPLTALALKQGGYDWGYLAYAVGFGGSMIWFGSSAGVALTNMYPEAKSVGRWITPGLADRGRLRHRILRDARRARLASRRAALSGTPRRRVDEPSHVTPVIGCRRRIELSNLSSIRRSTCALGARPPLQLENANETRTLSTASQSRLHSKSIQRHARSRSQRR